MILVYSQKIFCKSTFSNFRSQRYFFLYGRIRPHSAYRGGVRFVLYEYIDKKSPASAPRPTITSLPVPTPLPTPTSAPIPTPTSAPIPTPTSAPIPTPTLPHPLPLPLTPAPSPTPTLAPAPTPSPTNPSLRIAP